MEKTITIQERMQNEKVLRCPKCNVKMHKRTNGTYIIDGCPTCGGIWLDREEINMINKQGFIHHVKSYWRR